MTGIESVKSNDFMRCPLRVLMVEDSVNDTLLTAAALQSGGLDPVFERVETAASMQAALDVQKWDLVICDYSMPHFTGAAALAIYQQKGVDIPFIGVSGTIGEENVAGMMKAGAHDYVMKNQLGRLVPVVKRELRAAQERRERRQTETDSAYLASLIESCNDAIIGRSTSVLVPRYRPEELPEIYDAVKRGEAVDGLETVRIRKDGTSVEVSLTISPIKDAGGQMVGASSVARAITRRKQEENERLGLIKDLT